MTDRELVIEAVRKAGHQKALAQVFGVAQSAISEWGRTRPIPRHVRPRLEEYLKSNRSADETADRITGSGEGVPPAAIQDLVHLLRGVGSHRLANLPGRYRRRYDERVAEVMARVRRELEEYQAVLEAEHRARPARQKRTNKSRKQ